MSFPQAPSEIPLSTQVGGHAGVLTTEGGLLLIKPALAREVAFYQTVNSDPSLATLREFVPQFYGTLRLEGKVDPETPALGLNAIKPVETASTQDKDSIVLENLTYTFLKPNVLDIKLGTVLYDEDAPPEKRARMEKVARETTSGETGMRLTGFQVYDLSTDRPIVTAKAYGKSIKTTDLPDGIARFFPLASSSASPGPQATTDAAPTPPYGTGLPEELLVPMLSGIRSEVDDIREALSEVDMRMVGGSILIVYEADWERAREGLLKLSEPEEEEESDDEDEEEGSEDSSTKPLGPPFVVKLIDFAHTRILPGQGPDQGVLLGLRTLSKLLDGRIEQIRTTTKDT